MRICVYAYPYHILRKLCCCTKMDTSFRRTGAAEILSHLRQKYMVGECVECCREIEQNFRLPLVTTFRDNIYMHCTICDEDTVATHAWATVGTIAIDPLLQDTICEWVCQCADPTTVIMVQRKIHQRPQQQSQQLRFYLPLAYNLARSKDVRLFMNHYHTGNMSLDST